MSMLFVVFLCIASISSGAKFNVIKVGTNKFRVTNKAPNLFSSFVDSQVVADCEYNHTRLELGWDTMKIVTNPQHSDEDQAYAAGFFEGSQTFNAAFNHYHNNYPTEPEEYVINFLLNHSNWLEQTITAMKANNTIDPYWAHVSLMWTQWKGLYDGMNSVAPTGKNFSKGQLLVLTSMGDMFDLVPGLKQPHNPGSEKWRTLSKTDFMTWFAGITHCSCLYKLLGDMSDIFFGHVSWYNYNTMNRIFKHYTLNFAAAGTTAKTISMSSYPGMLSSFDDFYLTDSGFSIIETSLGVLNETMYDGNIKVEYLLYWMRVMVANRMASSAPNWAQLVAYRNSGTYNNQWMILDLNLFTPGKDLLPNTMWVAEQLPGIVAAQDVTDFLRYGYYPSYNVPMNKTLFELSGYADAVKTQGQEMNDYQMCVRAQIFRRDQGKVQDLASFKQMMQYNDFEVDPISQGNPLYAISSRADLNPTGRQCFGALDAKVSSYKMWKKDQTVHAFCGPTPQQPTFGFNITDAKCGPHAGLPEVFQYNWIEQAP